MKIYMDDSRLTDVTKLKKFLKGSQGVNLSLKKLSIDQRIVLKVLSKDLDIRDLNAEKNVLFCLT